MNKTLRRLNQCPAGYQLPRKVVRCTRERGHRSDGKTVFGFHDGEHVDIDDSSTRVVWDDTDPNHVPTAASRQQELLDVR